MYIKKKKSVLYLFMINTIFLLMSCYGYAEEYPDYSLSSDIELSTSLSNTLYILKESNDYNLKSVDVYVSFFPRDDYRQEILDIMTSPEAEINDDFVKFSWNNVEEDKLDYQIESNVRTKHLFYEIDDKVAFPIKDDLSKYGEYLVQTDTIDYSNPKIRSLATDLASGEDDLFVVTHKFAEWVNTNIEYDLNTMTADASQKASWVIDTRSGVCDELTNLFIALCRSAGIPAKFVTGLAYTTKEEFPDRWSPHGWAEVYFPGYGWVPFDVTYGEMGYLDAGHIKLKDAVDANRSSTKYEWYGYGANLKGSTTKLDTEVLSVGENVSSLLDLNAWLIEEDNGFGSYNALIVDVTNNNDFYVPSKLLLSKTKEIEVFDKYRRFVLLEPKSSERVVYIFKIDNDFDKRYVYNFTFSVRSFRGAEDTVNLISKYTDTYYSLSDIRGLLPAVIEKDKEISKKVDLFCFEKEKNFKLDQSKSIFEYINYSNSMQNGIDIALGDDLALYCIIFNNGNVKQSEIDVCFKENCKRLDLEIGEFKGLDFSYNANRVGENELVFNTRGLESNVIERLKVEVNDIPKIDIGEIKYPEEVSIKQPFTIEFGIDLNEFAKAYNVSVELETTAFSKDWYMEELDRGRNFLINIDSYVLGDIENTFNAHVVYNDIDGNVYSDNKYFTVRVNDATLLDKGIMFLNKMNFDIRNEYLILVVAALFAGIVIGLVMRRGSSTKRMNLETEDEEEYLEEEIDEELKKSGGEIPFIDSNGNKRYMVKKRRR